MTSTNDPRIIQALIESSKHFQSCILCKKPTRNRGLFLPEEKGLFGAPKDKYRVMIYAICYKHVETQEKAESVLLDVEKYLEKNDGLNITREVFGNER